MATHTFSFPGHPALLNALLRAHWAERGRLKRNDRTLVYFAARAAGVPRAAGKRRVSLHLAGWARGGPFPDRDNCLKSVLDALVAAALLTDDDSAGVELGPVTFERGPDSTRVTLEDL